MLAHTLISQRIVHDHMFSNNIHAYELEMRKSLMLHV